MFSRIFTTISRKQLIASGAAGVGLFSAAAVSISNPSSNNVSINFNEAEFKKKPSWYRETVDHLENVIKELSLKSYVEDPALVDDAIDILQRVENVNNCEISWRLGRAMVEKANLYPGKETGKKVQYLEKAIGNLKKALQLESPSKGVAGAHKWYAVALMRLREIDPKNPHVKKAQGEILQNLEKAAKLDPNDAITAHLIGFCHLHNGNFEEALKQFRKAEEIKSDYSVANKAYMGIALGKLKQNDEAKSMFKKAMHLKARTRPDIKAKADARKYAQDYLKMTADDLSTYEAY